MIQEKAQVDPDDRLRFPESSLRDRPSFIGRPLSLIHALTYAEPEIMKHTFDPVAELVYNKPNMSKIVRYSHES